jgi:phosphoenolpyruvate carboxylase
LYATLDESVAEREVFMSKILEDYENGVALIEELFEDKSSNRREGQYDNLQWRNEKLNTLHHLHIKYLKQWRDLTDDDNPEKEKTLSKLLSIINSISSGLKNTG